MIKYAILGYGVVGSGVAEVMDGFVRDPLNRLAWENLRDCTLTLGNDAESADADS